jgi:hypothetical protein
MGDADFFGWLEIVDVAMGLDDSQLYGAHGLHSLLVALHVALVGCSGIRQMGFDKVRHKAMDGCKFLASF